MIALIILFTVPFIISPGAEFGGADDGAGEVIVEMSPGYEPWFNSFWEPPGETESMLFALQAAIGAIIIGYVIGYLRGSSAQ
ncbi:energy-coupling factor ABC transporter substrate-binding protein [Methanocella sp. CWC-04]|uniref:Cobalt transport protein CbiN n=1 Tax=Methanooceanicella nereidis TaxID=2052831 RepID=A0AAP2RFZ4_9EURY|nr:energy-coupling factor ABC transporter substrate-binding protein [Methanocella sp. CWC-04]